MDLDAVVANWRSLADRVGNAECAAVVKADAYGIGSAEVAKCLKHAGCRSFFVASLDEGIMLRHTIGANAHIYVFNGLFDKHAVGEFGANRLIPVLNSPGDIALWSAYAQDTGGQRGVLAIDTGMQRLGLTPDEARDLSNQRQNLSGITVDFVMSHLACADDRTHPMNSRQQILFDQLLANLSPLNASLANSAGIFLGPSFHYNLVRPGAALYGISPDKNHPQKIQQVVGLKGKIIQIRVVDNETSVGYGAEEIVPKNTRLATVAVGYADGILRSLGNKGCGYAAGIEVPIVGRVSMDLTTFDITHVAPGRLSPGDEIDLICAQHTVDDLASEAGTIGYEVLTALGTRYQRRYLGGTK
ncbi:MAG: alanine racemase [Pseudomonadota bacterium]|nr:alanine racemase [Pseudomonadota bacterium]